MAWHQRLASGTDATRPVADDRQPPVSGVAAQVPLPMLPRENHLPGSLRRSAGHELERLRRGLSLRRDPDRRGILFYIRFCGPLAVCAGERGFCGALRGAGAQPCEPTRRPWTAGATDHRSASAGEGTACHHRHRSKCSRCNLVVVRRVGGASDGGVDQSAFAPCHDGASMGRQYTWTVAVTAPCHERHPDLRRLFTLAAALIVRAAGAMADLACGPASGFARAAIGECCLFWFRLFRPG